MVRCVKLIDRLRERTGTVRGEMYSTDKKYKVRLEPAHSTRVTVKQHYKSRFGKCLSYQEVREGLCQWRVGNSSRDTTVYLSNVVTTSTIIHKPDSFKGPVQRVDDFTDWRPWSTCRSDDWSAQEAEVEQVQGEIESGISFFSSLASFMVFILSLLGISFASAKLVWPQ